MPAPRDPVPVLNVSGEDIPSHAVVEPTGERVDGAMCVRKPTRNGFRGVWVNGDGVIPAGKAGQATRHPGVVVLVDGSPELGEEWGSRAGSWKLHDVGGGGFIVNDDAPYDGRVNAIRYGVRDVDPSGSGSGTDSDGDGTADRRLVGYNYDVSCSGGVLTKTRQPIYQFLGSGLSSYGGWQTVGAIGCCECDSDPADGGPTGGGGGGGGTSLDNVPCDDCFGVGKAHPSPNEPDVPADLTVTWTDLGNDDATFAHDDGTYDWQSDGTGLTHAAFTGLINMTVTLCTGSPPTGYQLTMNYTDNTKDATIDLTMTSCDPIMLVGEGAQGRVVVTE